LDCDRDRYDRQARTIGRDAMQRILRSKTLIVGMGGLGAEIAKNLVLMGVKHLTLHDNKDVTFLDLSSQFLVNEDSIGKNRAVESLKNLCLLNEHADIQVHNKNIDEEFLKKFSVVIFTDDHISHLIEYNEICRKNGVKFIATESRGLFGSIFVDFGNNFEVLDKDGEQPSSGVVVNITSDDNGIGIIDIKDEANLKPHGLSDGDIVTFKGVEGMTQLNDREFVVKRVDPYRFSIGNVSKFRMYAGGGYYFQIKKPVTLHFISLAESLKDPQCMIYDYSKPDYPISIHRCMMALADFKRKHEKLPEPRNELDIEEMIRIAKEFQNTDLSELDISLLRGLANTSKGQLNPMATFLGGFVAQEAQKATTQKFTPIQQWFHFESLSSLPDEQLSEEDCQVTGSRYDGQIVVFGKKLQKIIENQKIFLVGAGALGCEFLKNFAMMGACCGPRGKLIVTDLDSIENSNLSRQFLFRKEHIGKMKSAVGAESARRMNPHLNVEALQDRVGPETENIFNEKFWNSLDLVTNALDNIEARKYVDSKCIFFKKPLLESGTLGTKANVQVIYPDLTESYGSQKDTDETNFPECTIHFFPNVIQHTITWAKSIFKSMFHDNLELVNEYLQDPKKFLSGEKGNNIIALETINDYLVRYHPKSFKDCIAWARLKFEEQFNWGIRNIILTYPPDKKTRSGALFWSGTKRCPTPIEFDKEDPAHMMYIEATSILLAQLYKIERDTSIDMKQVVQQVEIPEYIPNPIEDSTNEEDKKEETETKQEKRIPEEEARRRELYINELQSNLINLDVNSNYTFVPIEFEKDSEANYHVEFMTACSNLRARSYKIPEVDKWTTKGIAGNIIPAMITTTALVTGLVMFELYKALDQKKLEDYRNTFLNIAIPFITMSEPVPPKKEILGRYTVWDTIDIDEQRDITLNEFVQKVNTSTNFQVLSVTYFGTILYTFFMDRNKLEKRANLPMTKLIEALTKERLDKKQTVLSLQVLAMDPTQQDPVPFTLPRVKYQFKATDNKSAKDALLEKKRALLNKRKRIDN
jgi:ubiquitin-activating enzyme E1